MTRIDLTGYDTLEYKISIIERMWRHLCRLGYFIPSNEWSTSEAIRTFNEFNGNIDHLFGVPIQTDFSQSEIDSTRYNELVGEGVLELIVQLLKEDVFQETKGERVSGTVEHKEDLYAYSKEDRDYKPWQDVYDYQVDNDGNALPTY